MLILASDGNDGIALCSSFKRFLKTRCFLCDVITATRVNVRGGGGGVFASCRDLTKLHFDSMENSECKML